MKLIKIKLTVLIFFPISTLTRNSRHHWIASSLRADVDGRQLARERGRQRPLVRRLRVVHGEAAQLLVPGVLADEAVDVVLAVLLLGLVWKWLLEDTLSTSTLCGVCSVAMFCFVIFRKFWLPIGLHSSCNIWPNRQGNISKMLHKISRLTATQCTFHWSKDHLVIFNWFKINFDESK